MSEQLNGYEAPTSKPLQTPEQVLPETSAEQVKLGKYEALLSDTIDVAKNRNLKQREVLMDEFLDQVLSDAEKGDVKGSNGTYTAEDLRLIFKDLYHGLMHPVDSEDPIDYLPRTEGLRKAVATFLLEDSTSKALLRALYERSYGPSTSEELRSTSAINEVGGSAVESAGIKKPVVEIVEIQDPLSAFSQMDQNDIMRYRTLVANKRESERTKNYAQAAEDGRSKHDHIKNMSTKAKNFLGISL